MLSFDRIESANFIHGTLSLAKLVYYNIQSKNNFYGSTFIILEF